jgi:hypothetical protein
MEVFPHQSVADSIAQHLVQSGLVRDHRDPQTGTPSAAREAC